LQVSLKHLRRVVENTCRKFSCDYVLLFGSQARGDRKDYSDIDLAVTFTGVRNHLSEASSLAFQLEESLGRKVDVLPLNIADSVIKYEVFSHGILLYCKDYARYLDDHVNAVDEYLDFQPRFERFYRKTLRELKDASSRG